MALEPLDSSEQRAIEYLLQRGVPEIAFEDGTGVTVTEYGSDVTYNTDPSPVFVPRHGEIYFTGSAPSNWDWYWE